MVDSSATPEEKFDSCTCYGEIFISLLFYNNADIDVLKVTRDFFGSVILAI